MNSLLKILLLFFTLSAAAGQHAAPAGQDSGIDLYFFWSRFCPHCLEAKPFVEQLAAKYPWLRVYSFDLAGNPDNIKLYVSKAESLGMPANSVPGFIFCGQMLTGYDYDGGRGHEIEQKLINCRNANPDNTAPAEVELPIVGKIHYRDFSLPVLTLLIAGLDAFNPCAFFVLLFLLSLIGHTRSRTRIAIIGGIFVFFSGLMYFVFMAAWLNLFLLTQELAMITAAAGLIAVGIGIINVKDYFYFQQGLSLSIPDSAKPKLFHRMRDIAQAGHWPAMLAATILLAVAANSYELLCTAGLPMVYTRLLTLHDLSVGNYYLYLVFYNVIYIVPLLMIVVLYARTFGSKKLSERQGRLLKLLSGLMMLGLGSMLLLAPELLNNMLVSVSIVAAAVLGTLLCYFLERPAK